MARRRRWRGRRRVPRGALKHPGDGGVGGDAAAGLAAAAASAAARAAAIAAVPGGDDDALMDTRFGVARVGGVPRTAAGIVVAGTVRSSCSRT